MQDDVEEIRDLCDVTPKKRVRPKKADCQELGERGNPVITRRGNPVTLDSDKENVPDRRSVKCLDPRLQGVSLGGSVCGVGWQPKPSPAPIQLANAELPNA
jgi:hypothetical protein